MNHPGLPGARARGSDDVDVVPGASGGPTLCRGLSAAEHPRLQAVGLGLAESQRMGEELWNLLSTERLAEKVRPL